MRTSRRTSSLNAQIDAFARVKANHHYPLNLYSHCVHRVHRLHRVHRVHQVEQRQVFERAHLLLAGSYITKKKYDLAQDMCRKVIRQNKGCFKAYEVLGQVTTLTLCTVAPTYAYKKKLI